MPQVLYRKYRPKTFAEIEDQEHVVKTLEGALTSGRIGHAYMFSGPRGTGKTTMARLLAKALNCEKRVQTKSVEPCNKCDTCLAVNDGRSLDLIEIDAASNRGIDEIRSLKDSAQVAATGGGYKVFIIDEVHMLTAPAFNALLKILEEPPSHVIFVMATTEPYKVPETILSRVQRFDFRKISRDKIIGKLTRIAKAEKVRIEEPALAMLASTAGGSLRDAESALNKIMAHSAGEDITTASVAEAFGIVPTQVHESLIKVISQKNPQEAIAAIARLYESGVDLDNFIKQFIKYLRLSLIASVGSPAAAGGPAGQTALTPEFMIKAINLLVKAGSEMRYSPIPQLPLELAILELTK